MLDNNQIRLPAEWEQQRAVILVWPHIAHSWQEEGELLQVTETYLNLAFEITRVQELIIVAFNTNHLSEIKSELLSANIQLDKVSYCIAPTNDVWVRDTGPITIYTDTEKVLYNFQFNAWGKKYSYEKDNDLNYYLAKSDSFNEVFISQNFILEGGAIESDGAGTILVTHSSLVDVERNNISKRKIEKKLKEIFNLKRILWLENGKLQGDDTDGHIDTLARFINHDTICFQGCENKDDGNYTSLKKMKKELSKLTTLDGKPYTLIELPMPRRQYDNSARRLPSNYLNFIIINNAVLVPTYDVPEDNTALNILAKNIPDREIIGINAKELITQNGSLHCASMNLYK